MASRAFSRVSRRIVSSGRSIGAAPSLSDPIRRLVPASGGCRFPEMEQLPYNMNKPLQQPFIVNSTLQRFGISSSASRQSAAEATQLPTGHSSDTRSRMASFSFPGVEKIPPYPLLFRWIDEIILDYVHHEVTRTVALLYLRLFLVIFMKDVFLGCYDLLGF